MFYMEIQVFWEGMNVSAGKLMVGFSSLSLLPLLFFIYILTLVLGIRLLQVAR